MVQLNTDENLMFEHFSVRNCLQHGYRGVLVSRKTVVTKTYQTQCAAHPVNAQVWTQLYGMVTLGVYSSSQL